MLQPPPIRRGTRRSRAAAALIAGLVLCGAPGPFAAPSPAAADPSEIDADTAVTLTIAPVDAVLDPSAESYELSVQIDNQRLTEVAGGRLSLELSPTRVEGTEQLFGAFPNDGIAVTETEIGATEPEGVQITELTVERAELPLADDAAPGVYRLRAALAPEPTDGEGADAPIVGDIPFVWRGIETGRTDVAMIVPLVLPPQVQSMPTREHLDEAVPRLDSLVDAATRARATLAIDPRIIAGIRAYGENASQQSRRFLDRLESTALPSFLLQFADADPAAQAALGYTELLQPTSLAFVTHHGSFAPPDDALTDIPGAPPTLDELLAWPQEVAPTAWPAEGQVDRATLDLLRSNAVTEAVLSSGNATVDGGPRATVDGVSALITDDALGAAVRAALMATSDAERESATAIAAAGLALAAEADPTGLVIALDRGATAESDEAASLIEDLLELDWVAPVAAADLPAGTAELRSASTLEERRELLRSAMNQEPNVNQAGSLLANPEFLTGYQRARVLDLFATHYARTDADFAAVAARFGERDAELQEGVSAISTEHTQLVGTSTRVPLQLRNALPFEAVVDVSVAPASAALRVTEREFTDVAIGAEANASVLVPVRSRVSSGESALMIEVTDTSGEYLSDTSRLSVSIRSSIETVGLWTLGAAAALLLVFGTVRSLRRRRARSSGDPSGEGSPNLE